VKGDASIRLFCALRLPAHVLDALVDWGRGELREGGGTRRVARPNLHVTLAFLGHRREHEVQAIAAALREAAATARPGSLRVSRYRETRSVGMLVLDDEERVTSTLAEDLHERLEQLDVYERERRPWLPHVTVLRFRERPRLRPSLPELGTFSPSDAALYHSVLRSTGAQYEVLDAFALGGA
jgi:2'-5' RNA ligase